MLSRQRQPIVQFCKKIARGLGLSDIAVLRRAGFTDDGPPFNPIIESAVAMTNQLPEDDQEELREIIRVKYERRVLKPAKAKQKR